MKDTDRLKLMARQEELRGEIERLTTLQDQLYPHDREEMRRARAWYLKQVEEDPPPG